MSESTDQTFSELQHWSCTHCPEQTVPCPPPSGVVLHLDPSPTCGQSKPPDPFSWGCSPASHLPVCTYIWGCPVPLAESSTPLVKLHTTGDWSALLAVKYHSFYSPFSCIGISTIGSQLLPPGSSQLGHSDQRKAWPEGMNRRFCVFVWCHTKWKMGFFNFSTFGVGYFKTYLKCDCTICYVKGWKCPTHQSKTWDHMALSQHISVSAQV